MSSSRYHWAYDALFYHIYPLGFCGAPDQNDFASPAVERLDKVAQWIPHIRSLGVNALYLGPLFESSAHGYDTVDYYHVDRRLGSNATLKQLSGELHRNGIRLILDGVFNHVGRDFWAFYDVRQHGQASRYCDWFEGLRFEGRSQYGDPFTYEGWNGSYDLVKLNLRNREVRTHLFEAIRSWVETFGIDGLRLDVAEILDMDFLHELRQFTHGLRADFWLMGEVTQGDYRKWVNPETLDSVTDYECYKSLYSSLVDRNYFEMAWSLNRQFGDSGISQGAALYNFADNHDVNRVASQLPDPKQLPLLYTLLFSMPGVPSIYYGSEWGIQARRTRYDDRHLRPSLDLAAITANSPHPELPKHLAKLAAVRHDSPALKYGDYRQLHVASEQLAFIRRHPQQSCVVVLNAGPAPLRLEIDLQDAALEYARAVDLLDPAGEFRITDGTLVVDRVPGCGARILELR
jgi:cyclomaltodextrinase